jgi:7,8-dihydropterin-6-yl-methyl-4-(beta-D-ribofuranosyl)aminobenzene 5'-phosphate synthase
MTEEVCITILVENKVYQRGLLAEHGLAYHIAMGKRQVLFDTGQTDLLVANAQQLGVDLSCVDIIALSHGHYDHTGGLAALRQLAPEARIVMHPAATAAKFAASPDGSSRRAGMSEASLNALATARVEFCEEQPVELVDGLFATGGIPRVTSLEDVGGRFFLDPASNEPDPILDDQALYFASAQGTVVLLGCAHAGVINTLRHIESVAGASQFASVLGGMHLLNASEERIRFTLEELSRRDIPELVPMHCTGWDATARLWNSFPGRCRQGSVGTRLHFKR